MTAADLVEAIRARGVSLRTDGERIGVRPVAALTAEEREALTRHRREVIAVLALEPSGPIGLRVAAFRAQYQTWRAEGRETTEDQVGLPGGPHPAVPTFAMPGLDNVDVGHCLACSEVLPPERAFRCSPCVDAIRLVLEEAAP